MAGVGKVVSLVTGSHRALAHAKRKELLDLYQHYQNMSREWLRREIIHNNRVDILATAILGYKVEPLHLAMMQFQFRHPDNLQLVFRGAGKTTVCTITKAIHLLIKDPNLRIMIASKTTQNSESFLKEIKSHLESNDKLVEVFGEFYDPQRVRKWDNREIDILQRTRYTKESNLACVGVDSAVVSRHVDVILGDDVVDEENSRTKHMRDKTKTWYYQTLDPCLEPPDDEVPHRGEHHRLGTRYHYDDLYGHLIENELKDAHQIIPALDEEGNSPWPQKYPPKWFEEKKSKAGIVIFNCQYQCDTEAMRGEVYQYDDCQQVDDDQFAKESALKIFMGVDLAVGEKEKNDQFAIVVVGRDSADNYWTLDRYAGFIRFAKQLEKFDEMYKKWNPILAGVESNAYQKVMYQELKARDKDYRIVPIYTHKDKMTRAWKLSPLFEDKRMFFRKGMNDLIDQLVLFPNHPLKDLWDALDLAVQTSRRRKRRKAREDEPGLI